MNIHEHKCAEWDAMKTLNFSQEPCIVKFKEPHMQSSLNIFHAYKLVSKGHSLVLLL